MVFFYTSSNIKVLKNVWMDYEDAEETSPYDYIKGYIEKCPADVNDQKLTWVAETFLGHQKHFGFLKEIATHLSEELSEEDQDNFIIIFYAIIFQLEPKDMELIYKSMFNLSKPLLNTFTGFLSNNEQLTYISQVAQTYYDASYVTDKIIAPLFVWQPYISEMAHTYAEFIKGIESRKVKPLTVPIQPNVLNRKGKAPVKEPIPSPIAPPNSDFSKNRKMLTKSVIDKKLKIMHDKNKQNAANLLSSIQNEKDFHYARRKSECFYKKISYDESVLQNFSKPRKIVSKSSIPVRDNVITVKRMNMRAQMTEQQEVEWIQNLMSCCRNPARIEELMEYERKEKEKDRLYDIEKKHLLGQISHEEAALAKKKLEEENKKKYEEFLKEKEKWEKTVIEWKQSEMQKCRAAVENVSMNELKVLEAKNTVLEKKKENAIQMKKASEERMVMTLKRKQEELDEKVQMIKQIKILSVIARKSKVPKIIDLTESSGVGLLCEMSIAELQERLAALKMSIKEELQQRKDMIKQGNDAAKKDLEETKNSIKAFITERAEMRKQAKTVKKPPVVLDGKNSKVIDDLKKTLEEKRKLRVKLETRNN